MKALLTEDPCVMSVVDCRGIALEDNKIGMVLVVWGNDRPRIFDCL